MVVTRPSPLDLGQELQDDSAGRMTTDTDLSTGLGPKTKGPVSCGHGHQVTNAFEEAEELPACCDATKYG